MKDKLFLDTNVFIYAYSKTEPEKKEIALKLLRSEEIVISTQVINEFIWVMYKKFKVEREKLPDYREQIIE